MVIQVLNSKLGITLRVSNVINFHDPITFTKDDELRRGRAQDMDAVAICHRLAYFLLILLSYHHIIFFQ